MSVYLGHVVVRVDLTSRTVTSELHVVFETLWVPSIKREPWSLRPALRQHNQLLSQHNGACRVLNAKILHKLPRLSGIDKAVSDKSVLVPDHRLKLRLEFSDNCIVHDHLGLFITDSEDHHIRISIDKLLTLGKINESCLAKGHLFFDSECLEDVLLTCLPNKLHNLLQISVNLL